MTDRVIPIADGRRAKPLPDGGSLPMPGGAATDMLGRHLRDLRISVTDRCNFRCIYCMPRDVFGPDYPFLARSELLTFEEIARLARVFKNQGTEKIRLTGGEPLLRKNLDRLIEMLAAIPGIDLTLTTNGSLLGKKARALKAAGLKRVTVSLDSLDERTFRMMNDADFPVSEVLAGIDAAAAAGLAPVKINMVVKRGATDGWRMDDVVPSAEVIKMIDAEIPLEQVDPNYTGEVAGRWRYRDGSGEIGVISSVTQAFCRTCTRARLSTEGMLYTCLFASAGYDLRGMLRGGSSDEEISGAIARIWQARADRYSEVRTAETAKLRKIEMSYIGG